MKREGSGFLFHPSSLNSAEWTGVWFPARSHKPYDAGSNPASATAACGVACATPQAVNMGCWSNLVRLLVCTQAIGVQLPGGPLFSALRQIPLGISIGGGR